MKKSEAYYKFSCTANNIGYCFPPSNVESGPNYTLSYRDEFGKMMDSNDTNTVYGPIKVSGARYIESKSKTSFNLTIEPTIEGIEYSLIPDSGPN